jgi:hypothetical protein
MARPTHRVSITRKDGKDITFTDYKGEQVSKKYCPIGALFPSKIDGGFSLSLERKVTLDPEVVWVNVYPNEEREEKSEKAPAKTGRRRTPPAEMFDESDLPD